VRGKTRTREHVVADCAINHVERQVLLCGFSVERVRHDYGYDLIMATYNQDGEYEPGGVYIQVKASDRLGTPSGGKPIPWSVSRRDLKLWIAETYPVILVVYDGQRDEAYWVHIQEYLLERPIPELFSGGETISIRIPVRNRFDTGAVQAIARSKNDIHKRFRGKGSDNV
jgi:hypothetical protein